MKRFVNLALLRAVNVIMLHDKMCGEGNSVEDTGWGSGRRYDVGGGDRETKGVEGCVC